MEQDQFCKVLCQVDLTKSDVAALKTIIREEYHHNWIIDNLPAASIVDSEQYIITAYAGGFPVGYQDHKASYLFNHVNIIVEYDLGVPSCRDAFTPSTQLVSISQ